MTFQMSHAEVLEAWRAGGQSTKAVAERFGCSMHTARERISAALAREARAAARVREAAAAAAATAQPARPNLVPPHTDLPPHLALRAVRAHGGNLTAAAAEMRVNRAALRLRVAQALRVPETAVTAALSRLSPTIDRPVERDADWRSQAACLSVDPEVFFPNSETATAQVATAKDVCTSCDVVDTCLSWALDTRQEHGIWGGTTPNYRRSLLRREAAARNDNDETTEEVA